MSRRRPFFCARTIQQMGLSAAKRRWEQNKQQASGVERSKLELERRRLLRSNPNLKLDTSAEVLDTLDDREKSGRASWNYFTPGVTTRRLQMRMRLVGVSVGIFTTLFVYVVLTLFGF